MQTYTEVTPDHSDTCNTVLRGSIEEFNDLANYLRDEPFDEFMEIITIKLDNATELKDELIFLAQEEIESLVTYLLAESGNDDSKAAHFYSLLSHVPLYP